MNKELKKIEKNKAYTYEEIKNIFDECVADSLELDEEKKGILREQGKTEEEISKFEFSQFLSRILFAGQISKKLFED